jgi:hypothetical protein
LFQNPGRLWRHEPCPYGRASGTFQGNACQLENAKGRKMLWRKSYKTNFGHEYFGKETENDLCGRVKNHQ